MAGSYNTVINLYLEDYSFVNCTENVMSIDSTRIASNVSASTVIEVYDDTALTVDSIIATLSDRKISFEYGYVNGAMSDRYSAIISKYQTQLTGMGALCTIECIAEGVVEQSLEDSSSDAKTYNGSISDIVYQVASEESWNVGKIETTEYKVFQIVRNEEDALKFIESIKDKAISADTGKGDYRVQLEDKNGSKVLYFATEIKEEDKGDEVESFDELNVYEYQYVLGMPNENIISFKPQYEQVLSSLLGATSVVSSSVDPETNEATEVEVAQTDKNKEEKDKNVKIENDYDDATKLLKRYVGGNAYSTDELSSMAKNLYDVASSLSYRATLVLKGKPRITPNTKVSILVLTRQGQRHHSSGSYCIGTVEDLIENGTYTTTLELLKNVDSVTVTVNQQPNGSSVWGGDGSGYGYGGSGNSQSLIWVGDSRTVGLQEACTSKRNDKFIAKIGMSYSWFVNTAVPDLESKLSSDPNCSVIICMGVNDVCIKVYDGVSDSSDKYANKINELIKKYPNTGFYFLSVNPCDNYTVYGRTLSASSMNSASQSFNNTIKSKCRAIYLDCYTYLRNNGYKTTDGIHYNDATYKKIYEFVLSKLPVSTGVSDGSFRAKVQKYLGTPYVWGGDSWSEGGFDCSGFVWYFLKNEMGSKSIGERTTAAELMSRGVAISTTDRNSWRLGDLLFPNSGHVVMWAGNGQVVHSPHTGDVIKYANLWFNPVCVRRCL